MNNWDAPKGCSVWTNVQIYCRRADCNSNTKSTLRLNLFRFRRPRDQSPIKGLGDAPSEFASSNTMHVNQFDKCQFRERVREREREGWRNYGQILYAHGATDNLITILRQRVRVTNEAGPNQSHLNEPWFKEKRRSSFCFFLIIEFCIGKQTEGR